LGLAAGLSVSLHAYPLQTLTTNVQPLNGTANDGDTFPGAVVPFGMVQWSPDTTTLDHSAGYFYPDTQIVGFSLDHLSGAGCTYGGDFAFTPILGNVAGSPANSGNNGRTGYPSTFAHASEIATPGYYSVQFTNGIRTELTVTTRTGFGRFTYPAGNPASLLINAGSGATGTRNASIEIDPGAREISGWTTQNGFCGSGQAVTVYFDAVLDQPFAAYGVWNGGSLVPNGTNAIGTETGVYLSFNLPGGGTVLARTAISYVSVANARNNLQAESPASAFTSAGFDAMAGSASNIWNGYLNKMQITGGTVADRQTFYTMMYHALQAPSVVGDANGQYIGFDNLIHTATNFTKCEFFSGWDIYRSECQFLAMMDPARASDMAQSLVQDAREGGAMPRWSVPSGDTGVMMGDPATPIIAGVYAFGATNFDTSGALAAMVRAAVDPAVVAANGIHERDAERDYLNLGYVPAAERGGYGPVSMTLEYCSADFALGQFSKALGDTANYNLAMNRAQNWRNHLNANSGYLQMRDADARWSAGFPSFQGQAYVEGTAYQYFWMVPFNLRSLAGLIGGPEAASARLDNFFTQINDPDTGRSRYAYMGNEPCSETPWIYSFLGKPYKTSAVVRQCVNQLFSTAPAGLPGNDDLGQMASWYVFAVLGLYPEIPGDNVLILNGPLFPQAVVHLANGDVTITGGAGDAAPYVQSLTLNGQTWSAPWLRFTDISGGGTLAFTMGDTPNTNWGADLAVAPPSYMDGMTAPSAPSCVWGTGLEQNDLPLSATNTVDDDSPGGGASNVEPITSGPTGPELVVRTENSQSGKNAIMYSGKASGQATEFAYLRAFDLTGQNLIVTPGMHLSYWVFPQSPKNSGLVTGSNSAFVALDLVFADESDLRDSGLSDQHGTRLHPADQGHQLVLDTWNYVTVDLTPLAGKTVSRIDVGYDQPEGKGGYRGYVDDFAFTTPAGWFTNNLALNQPSSADSERTDNPARNGNDGNAATAWLAADENTNHWWQVDLGAVCNVTADEVLWPENGLVYDYTVQTSLDGSNWTLVAYKGANTSAAQDQSDLFAATGRYVRITLTALPAGQPAGFSEFRVFGSKILPPASPSGLQAFSGYGFASLNWPPSAGAASYSVKRSTSSGTESTIASVTSTNYTDTGLAAGTIYYYVVSAKNVLGESGNSTEATATPTAPAPGSYQAALAAAHALAYWPLDETNGAIAFDPVGGFIGTYVGGVKLGQAGVPLPGFGSPSRAATFDGASGCVDIPAGPFNITSAVTVTAWVSLPAAPGHYSGIFGHGDGSWRITVDPSGQPGAADGGAEDATSHAPIVGHGWHMVAYTYTGAPNAADNGTLYVDGQAVAHNSVTAITGGDADVFIGGSPDYATDRLLAGSVAHAAVFANSLSAAEILALYKAATNTP
jgi:predicted alpha-1,2-mannosidase